MQDNSFQTMRMPMIALRGLVVFPGMLLTFDVERPASVAALAQAGKGEQLIFLARYWFLSPIAEIAQKARCSQSKVKTTLFRLRKKLQTMLQEEGLW